jgi:NTE family protein
MSKILVLSGGSVKGAFQAGVMKAIMERGYQPDAVYGVSAGSLNAAYFVNQLGLQSNSGEPISFLQASQDLWDFWETRITSPESLSKPFNIFQLGLSALRKKFIGLVDTQPLRNLLTEVLSIRNLHASPISLKIGAVNIIDGTIYYVDTSEKYFLDYLMASSAVPILMPVVKINEESRRCFLDGGLRDVAPIKKAVEDGASQIICISCHMDSIEGGHFDSGDLLALVDRVMDIAVNEILNLDIREVMISNERLPNKDLLSKRSKDKGQTKIDIQSIRPPQPLTIDIQNFNKLDIRRMLELGYQVGRDVKF